jgi:hypothetical protein
VEILQAKGDAKDQTFFVTCQPCTDFLSAVRHIAAILDPKPEIRPDRASQEMLNLLRSHSSGGRRPLLLFLDEFDSVVRYDCDNNWPFLRCLHAATDGGWVRVVFAGWREVSKIQFADPSPFFKRLRHLNLPPLQRDDVRDLFVRPIRRMGIQIREEHDVVSHLLCQSAGSPHVIQFYGEQLFHAKSPLDSKELTLQEIQAAENTYHFDQYIMGHVFENTSELERAMLLAVTQSSHERWTLADFQRALQATGPQADLPAIDHACRNLVAANIFEFDDAAYKLLYPGVRDRIRRNWQGVTLADSAPAKRL